MPVRWAQGGEATVLSLDGERVELLSTRPFPPGAPASGALAREGEAPLALTVKVAGSVLEGDRYRVRGRLVNATRALREALTALREARSP
ncbi:MAG: hypothetical protein HY909_25200 [Deltaproteobacteria bacterium]|nr:hypothetical protein [Deltaproteobacteria bacterium]